jgi:hypothetical protein
MSYPDPISYPIAALCCALSLMPKPAPAADSHAKQANLQPRTFEAAIHNGETVGWQQVRRVFVACGTNEFVFVAPYGLRMTGSADSVTLVSTNYTYFLEFRILATAIAQPNLGDTDCHREFLLSQFPGAKVLEAFSKTAAGRSGPAFELRVKIAGGAERAVCVAMIPCAAGVLEFSYNADLSKSSDAKAAFNSLLRTFRSNERGKNELDAQVPDNS